MTEKEKMVKGILYNANYDEQIIKERTLTKELCFEYNQTIPSNYEKREEIIRKLFSHVGQKPMIEQNFWCDYGYNISVGDNFYMNHNCIILDPAKVEFGDNVFIGPNCGFYTALHPIDIIERNKGLETCEPITVGNNVWFGGNVVVFPGVTIGDNVTIGAGSVVTKDIPSNCVAFGNPCKVIRELEPQTSYTKVEGE